jgi:signal transduction histidine kinase
LQVYAETSVAGLVTGNRTLLTRMVANLIDNAVVHNVPGGWLHLVVTGPTLLVSNSGPVLDPESVARLGRPFERLLPHHRRATPTREPLTVPIRKAARRFVGRP